MSSIELFALSPATMMIKHKSVQVPLSAAQPTKLGCNKTTGINMAVLPQHLISIKALPPRKLSFSCPYSLWACLATNLDPKNSEKVTVNGVQFSDALSAQASDRVALLGHGIPERLLDGNKLFLKPDDVLCLVDLRAGTANSSPSKLFCYKVKPAYDPPPPIDAPTSSLPKGENMGLIIECAICHDTIWNAHMLIPCTHVLCGECAKNADLVTCPRCMKDVDKKFPAQW
ncbi:hypothetical protein TeGR_g8197 [Tetraparma gracilis]|nr:hypothetical protein TeGR_g8197 [Tetraparma gracilis]